MSLGQLLPAITTIRISDFLQRDKYDAVTQNEILEQLGIDRNATYSGPVLSSEELTPETTKELDRAIRIGLLAADVSHTKKQIETIREEFTFICLHVRAPGWAPVTE